LSIYKPTNTHICLQNVQTPRQCLLSPQIIHSSVCIISGDVLTYTMPFFLFLFSTEFDSWSHAAASSFSQPSSLSVSQELRQYEEARGRHLIFSQSVSSSNPAGLVPA